MAGFRRDGHIYDQFFTKGALFTHNVETQILSPFDSYINKQAMHVCVVGNSSTVCLS